MLSNLDDSQLAYPVEPTASPSETELLAGGSTDHPSAYNEHDYGDFSMSSTLVVRRTGNKSPFSAETEYHPAAFRHFTPAYVEDENRSQTVTAGFKFLYFFSNLCSI